MLIEQLIFTVISFALFVYIFLKMIKENDTTYIIFLVLEAIGITFNFIEVLFSVKFNIFIKILIYIFSIILPIILIVLEKRNINLLESITIFKAKIYMKLEDNKKAKQLLIKLITKQSNTYEGHKLLAEIYELEGGMRKAIDEYVQAIDINKKDYDSYYKVADLLNNLDKKDEASEMLTNLLNKRPDYYKASELLGDILISKEMYKEAVNIYQEALKYNPISFDLNYNLGLAYTMLNDFQSAKTYYEKAAQINSLIYNTKYSLAEIALIYKDLEQAEKRFLESTEDEELSADAYFELAKISMIKTDKDNAIKYANIAIDINAKKIVDKIKKDPIFIPIFVKLSIPFNLDNIEKEENIQQKLKEKEKKCKKHLEEMVDITRHLSYNDIRLLKNNSMKTNNVQQKDELNQKEIQE